MLVSATTPGGPSSDVNSETSGAGTAADVGVLAPKETNSDDNSEIKDGGTTDTMAILPPTEPLTTADWATAPGLKVA